MLIPCFCTLFSLDFQQIEAGEIIAFLISSKNINRKNQIETKKKTKVFKIDFNQLNPNPTKKTTKLISTMTIRNKITLNGTNKIYIITLYEI